MAYRRLPNVDVNKIIVPLGNLPKGKVRKSSAKLKGDNKGQVNMNDKWAPNIKDDPALFEGTPEHEARKHKLGLWDAWDLVACDFMIKHALPNQFRMDCFHLIQKYDSQPERLNPEAPCNGDAIV